jgi:hypothetical protein
MRCERTATTTEKHFVHGHFWMLTEPCDCEISRLVKALLPASFAVLALASLTGCHRHSPAVYAHNKFCDENPQSVEVFVGNEPDRPYRVIGVVDGSFGIGVGRQVRKMQIRACRLGADAIVEQAPEAEIVKERSVRTPWGTFREEKVRYAPYGGALAIQFTDGPAAPAQPVVPNAPVAPPAEPDGPEVEPAARTTDGPIQIQTSGGIEIHAPSVEFRPAPQVAPAPVAPPEQQQPSDD